MQKLLGNKDKIVVNYRKVDETHIELIDPIEYYLPWGFYVTIPQGFQSDGTTITYIFWWLLGHPLDPEMLKASLLHDYLLSQSEMFTEKLLLILFSLTN